MDRTTFPATLASLAPARDFVTARAAGASDECLSNIELALEELLVNIVNHAYKDASGEVEIACGGELGVFTMEFQDQGPAFDPLARSDPDTSKDLQERAIGGLGIFLVKKLASEMRYERRGDTNWLQVRFSLNS